MKFPLIVLILITSASIINCDGQNDNRCSVTKCDPGFELEKDPYKPPCLRCRPSDEFEFKCDCRFVRKPHDDDCDDDQTTTTPKKCKPGSILYDPPPTCVPITTSKYKARKENELDS